MKHIIVALAVLVSMLGVGLVGVSAQDGMMEPMVVVGDQVSTDGYVYIQAAYSEGPGFIVIHQNNDGAVGPGVGFAHVPGGYVENIWIKIDASMATPVLSAMLHVDDSEVGVYEFGTVDGADLPVQADGAAVNPTFNLVLAVAHDQFVTDGTFTTAAVVTAEGGWLAIHADADNAPGEVIGTAPLTAGLNTDVVVTLEAEATNAVWVMLHYDTGEIGVYEFGTIEGADLPIDVNGAIATMPVWTVPHMRVGDQIVLYGDNFPAEMLADDMGMMGAAVYADSVLSEGAGWLVIHADNNGQFGAVLGAAPLTDGLNTDVVVELEGDITPVLWPMLHTDTGEAGVYEFGTVEGADGPVAVDGNVVTYPINAAPSLFLGEASAVLEGLLYVEGALIDAHGWLVIHSSVDGGPGPVLGYVRLMPGLTTDIWVALEGDAGSEVFPMLHYDTGEAGVYEFGAVEGADGPVLVGGSVVVAPLPLIVE